MAELSSACRSYASVTGLLIPKYAQDPPGPVQHLNPLAAICVINALYHHIWEFRSQLSVYFSLGVTVPFWEKDPDTEPKEMRDGFEGRKNVSNQSQLTS